MQYNERFLTRSSCLVLQKSKRSTYFRFLSFSSNLKMILKKTLQYRKNSHFKKRYLKFRYLTEICTRATYISTCTLMRISQELSALRSLEVT